MKTMQRSDFRPGLHMLSNLLLIRNEYGSRFVYLLSIFNLCGFCITQDSPTVRLANSDPLRIVENTFVCFPFYSRFTNSKNNEFGHSSYSRKYHTGISMCSPGRKSDRCIVFMVQRQFYSINSNDI
jgi:hypothetical protein